MLQRWRCQRRGVVNGGASSNARCGDVRLKSKKRDSEQTKIERLKEGERCRQSSTGLTGLIGFETMRGWSESEAVQKQKGLNALQNHRKGGRGRSRAGGVCAGVPCIIAGYFELLVRGVHGVGRVGGRGLARPRAGQSSFLAHALALCDAANHLDGRREPHTPTSCKLVSQ